MCVGMKETTEEMDVAERWPKERKTEARTKTKTKTIMMVV
jgi:hypothetical protein